MKTIKLCVLLMAAAASAMAYGASRSATMQVGLVILESCTVQSAGAAPRVACQLSSPYQIKRVALGADTLARAGVAADGAWEVAF